jgi:hypothetical protein
MEPNIADVLGVFGAFIKAAGLEEQPENIKTLITYVEDHHLPIDEANLWAAHQKLEAGYYAGLEGTSSETETCLSKAEVDSWSSDRLKAELRTRSAEINAVLRG